MKYDLWVYLRGRKLPKKNVFQLIVICFECCCFSCFDDSPWIGYSRCGGLGNSSEFDGVAVII